MENKLTRGTVIFIWFILVLSLLDLAAVLTMIFSRMSVFPFLSKTGSFLYYLAGWVDITAGLVLGVCLLRRKEWARKLFLIYAAVGLFATVSVRIPFLYLPKYKLQVSAFEDRVDEKWQKRHDELLPEDQLIMEKRYPKSEYAVKQKKAYALIMGIISAVLYGGNVLFSIMLLFFFSRSKVKAQFE